MQIQRLGKTVSEIQRSRMGVALSDLDAHLEAFLNNSAELMSRSETPQKGLLSYLDTIDRLSKAVAKTGDQISGAKYHLKIPDRDGRNDRDFAKQRSLYSETVINLEEIGAYIGSMMELFTFNRTPPESTVAYNTRKNDARRIAGTMSHLADSCNRVSSELLGLNTSMSSEAIQVLDKISYVIALHGKNSAEIRPLYEFMQQRKQNAKAMLPADRVKTTNMEMSRLSFALDLALIYDIRNLLLHPEGAESKGPTNYSIIRSAIESVESGTSAQETELTLPALDAELLSLLQLREDPMPGKGDSWFPAIVAADPVILERAIERVAQLKQKPPGSAQRDLSTTILRQHANANHMSARLVSDGTGLNPEADKERYLAANLTAMAAFDIRTSESWCSAAAAELTKNEIARRADVIAGIVPIVASLGVRELAVPYQQISAFLKDLPRAAMNAENLWCETGRGFDAAIRKTKSILAFIADQNIKDHQGAVNMYIKYFITPASRVFSAEWFESFKIVEK